MAEITAAQVKQLRDVSGAGMMDCKRALTATEGDLEKAKDWLREKGLARAAGKAGRSTNEGAIGHYLHTTGGLAKLGVLVEVNCESDFVAKTDDFKELAHDLAIQVAGANPQYVRREEVPTALVEREKAVYRRQVEGKPANIIDKIVDGKLEAFYGEICLVDQVYVRDENRKKKVRDLIAEKVAKLGENITVARFARVAVGEAPAEAAGGNGAAAAAPN
ncbi:MAG: translation elongation factor Ts [Candidatus Dormibacteria bacterium]